MYMKSELLILFVLINLNLKNYMWQEATLLDNTGKHYLSKL